MRRTHCNRLPAASRLSAAAPSIPPFIDSALVSPRAGLSGSAATRQLAEDMRQAGHREGGLSTADAELLGWTTTQLAAHTAAARTLAQQLSGLSL